MDLLTPLHAVEILAQRVKGKLGSPSPSVAVIRRVINVALEELGDEDFQATQTPTLSQPATAALAFSPVEVPPWLADLIARFVPEDKQAAAIVTFTTAKAEVAP